MNAINAIRESIFYKGARGFFILSGIALAVAALALTIFYSSFIALQVVAISLKVAEYTLIVCGGSLVLATVSATVCHVYNKVKRRVQILMPSVASGS